MKARGRSRCYVANRHTQTQNRTEAANRGKSTNDVRGGIMSVLCQKKRKKGQNEIPQRANLPAAGSASEA